MKCKNCGKEFPNKIDIDGKNFSLASRKFCLECSPLGSRNTRTYVVNLEENEAFCPRCSQIKDKKEFYLRKSKKPYSYCIKCQELVKNIKLQEKLERITEERGGSCADCGGCFPIPIYTFYKNGEVFRLTRAKNMSYDKLKIELSEFVMLCLNCSAIRKWVGLND